MEMRIVWKHWDGFGGRGKDGEGGGRCTEVLNPVSPIEEGRRKNANYPVVSSLDMDDANSVQIPRRGKLRV